MKTLATSGADQRAIAGVERAAPILPHQGERRGAMSARIEPMDDRTFHSYAHPKQKRRFCLALVFATLLFPLMALGLVAGTIFLIVPLFALLLWLAMRTYFAHLIG